MQIREETDADREAICDIHCQAFGGDGEARLVDALRSEGYAHVSLVAEVDGQLVGHILFSDLRIVTRDGVVAALAPAPLGVLPARQRQGVGTALTRQGIDACRQRGARIVIVLGHQEYYPRFGFSAELARPLESPYAGPLFMALELAPGALAGVGGQVEYPPPFSQV